MTPRERAEKFLERMDKIDTDRWANERFTPTEIVTMVCAIREQMAALEEIASKLPQCQTNWRCGERDEYDGGASVETAVAAFNNTVAQLAALESDNG